VTALSPWQAKSSGVTQSKILSRVHEDGLPLKGLNKRSWNTMQIRHWRRKHNTTRFCQLMPTAVHIRRKKITVVPVPNQPYFFLPTLLFFPRDWPYDPIFSRWLRAAHTACQNGICCHTNYWTKFPKFVHRKYASLVNIDVGNLLQIAQQKTAKTMKKIFKKIFISDLLTLIFSRYETGTTGIFFTPYIYFVLAECQYLAVP
jgi:hypothetical protein